MTTQEQHDTPYLGLSLFTNDTAGLEQFQQDYPGLWQRIEQVVESASAVIQSILNDATVFPHTQTPTLESALSALGWMGPAEVKPEEVEPDCA